MEKNIEEKKNNETTTELKGTNSKSRNFLNKITRMTSKASGAVSSAVVDSGAYMVKTTLKTMGKSYGYTEKGILGAYNGTKSLLKFDFNFNLNFFKKSGKKARGLFTGGLKRKFSMNKVDINNRIALLENQIRDHYLDIGKIGSENKGHENVFEDGEVKQIIERIKTYETEVNSLRKYLDALDEPTATGETLKKIKVELGTDPREDKIKKKIRNAIEDCIKRANIPLKSEAIMFKKAMYDLLDNEVDIKRLAVSELGKIGNVNAAPALKEALKIEEPELQAEIISALTQLESRDVFGICRSFINHDFPGIRAACVRGLYKSGGNGAVPFLIEALKDDNVEVRNSSAMFLGWLEAKVAVPSLLQAAKDSDKRIRKNAILSLSNIRDLAAVLPLIRLLDEPEQDIREKIIQAIERISGETVKFTDGNKKERMKAIEDLKDWWLGKRHEFFSDGQKPVRPATQAKKALDSEENVADETKV